MQEAGCSTWNPSAGPTPPQLLAGPSPGAALGHRELLSPRLYLFQGVVGASADDGNSWAQPCLHLGNWKPPAPQLQSCHRSNGASAGSALLTSYSPPSSAPPPHPCMQLCPRACFQGPQAMTAVTTPPPPFSDYCSSSVMEREP